MWLKLTRLRKKLLSYSAKSKPNNQASGFEKPANFREIKPSKMSK
jgi:hypothetical protein